VLRAIRLLNGVKLDGQELLLKVCCFGGWWGGGVRGGGEGLHAAPRVKTDNGLLHVLAALRHGNPHPAHPPAALQPDAATVPPTPIHRSNAVQQRNPEVSRVLPSGPRCCESGGGGRSGGGGGGGRG